MARIAQPYLFGWEKIDAAGDLDRLEMVLSAIPDEQFVSYLETRRGRGRDDYPIRPTWNALVAGIVLQHPSIASLVRDLRRNGQLRHMCGFDPHLAHLAVPTEDAFTRFLDLVIEHRSMVERMFHDLVAKLEKLLPDLGRFLAVDSKAIPSHGRQVRDPEKLADPDRRRDTDADWGTKTYKGVKQDGTKWEKVKHWFGYKLHLVVDSRYELPLGFELTKASAGDPDHMMPMVDELARKHPGIVETAEQLSGDKAYDTLSNYERPFDDYGIKPVIDNRDLWKDEKTRALFADRVDSFVYDEHGRVSCICPSTGETRDLFFHGFEHERRTLKYRCPAVALGLECKGRKECEARAKVGQFGRVVRVSIDKDRRVFTPLARSMPKWSKAYSRRTAVERVNSRLDNVMGFERHYIRGEAKMHVRVSLALVVMLSMAVGRIMADQPELMRSIVLPVRKVA
jgi:hypothetical protein